MFSDSQNEEIRGDLIGNIVVSVKGNVKWRDDEREIVKQMEGETRNRKKTLTTKGNKKEKKSKDRSLLCMLVQILYKQQNVNQAFIKNLLNKKQQLKQYEYICL